MVFHSCPKESKSVVHTFSFDWEGKVQEYEEYNAFLEGLRVAFVTARHLGNKPDITWIKLPKSHYHIAFELHCFLESQGLLIDIRKSDPEASDSCLAATKSAPPKR